MQAFKTKLFASWATGEGLDDDALASALLEMEHGLIDAHLGGQVVKQRVALKLLAKELFSYSAAMLSQAVEAGELIPIEVRDNG
jgi:hypothetical protein